MGGTAIVRCSNPYAPVMMDCLDPMYLTRLNTFLSLEGGKGGQRIAYNFETDTTDNFLAVSALMFRDTGNPKLGFGPAVPLLRSLPRALALDPNAALDLAALAAFTRDSVVLLDTHPGMPRLREIAAAFKASVVVVRAGTGYADAKARLPELAGALKNVVCFVHLEPRGLEQLRDDLLAFKAAGASLVVTGYTLDAAAATSACAHCG